VDRQYYSRRRRERSSLAFELIQAIGDPKLDAKLVGFFSKRTAYNFCYR